MGIVTYNCFSAASLNISDVAVMPSIHIFANSGVLNIFQPVKSDGVNFWRCVCTTLLLVVHHFRMVPSSLVRIMIRPCLVTSAFE